MIVRRYGDFWTDVGNIFSPKPAPRSADGAPDWSPESTTAAMSSSYRPPPEAYVSAPPVVLLEQPFLDNAAPIEEGGMSIAAQDRAKAIGLGVAAMLGLATIIRLAR